MRTAHALNSEPNEICTGTHEVRTQMFTYLFPIRTMCTCSVDDWPDGHSTCDGSVRMWHIQEPREADSLQLCGAIKLMFCSLRVNFWPFAETNYNTLCKRVLEKMKKKNSKLGQSVGSGRDARIGLHCADIGERTFFVDSRLQFHLIASHRLKKSSSSVGSRANTSLVIFRGYAINKLTTICWLRTRQRDNSSYLMLIK